jgi:hypothetical protein
MIQSKETAIKAGTRVMAHKGVYNGMEGLESDEIGTYIEKSGYHTIILDKDADNSELSRKSYYKDNEFHIMTKEEIRKHTKDELLIWIG